MCFQKIKEYFYEKKYNICPPRETEKIEYSELLTLLKSEFPNAMIIWTDKYYMTAPFSEFQRFVSWSGVDKYIYVPEYYDCDDFSFALFGAITIPKWSALTFGIIFTETPRGAHAVNFFVDKNREVWIVEPQNDSIFKLPSTWEPYFVLI